MGGGNSIAGKDIAGVERSSGWGRWIQARRGRIIDTLQGAVAIEGLGEIALSLSIRWHGSRKRGKAVLPEAFVGEEIESPVLAAVDFGYRERSTKREAELVLL